MSEGQSKRMSALETIVNYIIGFCLALAVQCFLMEIFGIGHSLGRDISITLIFTLLSIARSYAVRRFFNWLEHGKAEHQVQS